MPPSSKVKSFFSKFSKNKQTNTAKQKYVFSKKVQEAIKISQRKWPRGKAKVKHMDLSKLRPGDIILSTPAGRSIISGTIRLTLDSPYSHAIVYLGEQNGQHYIKEYKDHGAVVTTLERKLHRQPSNMIALRWKKSAISKRTALDWKGIPLEAKNDKRIHAFLQNVLMDTGKYDYKQAITYGLHELSNGRIKVRDDVRRRTCSELVADSAQPTAQEVSTGKKAAVEPPLIPRNVNREDVHPGVLYRAFKEGTWFEPVAVTQEEWISKRAFNDIQTAHGRNLRDSYEKLSPEAKTNFRKMLK